MQAKREAMNASEEKRSPDTPAFMARHAGLRPGERSGRTVGGLGFCAVHDSQRDELLTKLESHALSRAMLDSVDRGLSNPGGFRDAGLRPVGSEQGQNSGMRVHACEHIQACAVMQARMPLMRGLRAAICAHG